MVESRPMTTPAEFQFGDPAAFLRKQKDHCLAEEAVDENDNPTMWAFGGFVPEDAETAEIVEFFRKSPPFRDNIVVKNLTEKNPEWVAQAARMENQFRMALLQGAISFLTSLEKTNCSIRRACREAGINRTRVDLLKQRVPQFATRCAVVFEEITDKLEEAAYKRAVKGVAKPVFYKGEVVGHEQQFSDHLLAIMLQGRRPGTYRYGGAQSGPPMSLEEQALLAQEAVERLNATTDGAATNAKG